MTLPPIRPAYTGKDMRSRIFWPEGIGEWQTVRDCVVDTPKISGIESPCGDTHPNLKTTLITVNSRNEWTETNYFIPDNVYGYGYFEAVKRDFVE